VGLTLCNADAQCSEICIIDGAFAWQTVQREHSSLSDEPSSDSTAVTAEAPAVIPQLGDSSDEAAAGLVHDVIPANSIRPTLVNINFTIPKVNFMLLQLFYIHCMTVNLRQI